MRLPPIAIGICLLADHFAVDSGRPRRKRFLKIHQRVGLLLVATLLTTSVLRADASAPAPAITFDGTRVVISLTPGHTVFLFGAAQHRGGTLQLKRWQRPVTDHDNDGRAYVELAEAVAPNSVWIAVDSETGATGTAAPEYSEFRQITFPSAVLRKDASGVLDRYMTGREMVDLLVVRPRVGAWTGFAADGHESDADGEQNGGVTMTFSTLRRMHGNAPPPPHLTPHDVVVAVDLRRLEYYLTEVKQ
jgi:hypothetical protein